MSNFQNPATSAPGNLPAKTPEQANLDSQSVAGEEDPGAALDMPAGPPASQSVSRPPGAASPGGEATRGTPGTGDSICRKCGGTGHAAHGPCPSCNGSGKVTAAVGGA